jgi:hypothetical protein
MYNIDFTEYDQTFSKNAVILEKCSFRDNVTIRLYYFLEVSPPLIGQRRNLKSRLFKELNQPIDYTPKYPFKR